MACLPTVQLADRLTRRMDKKRLDAIILQDSTGRKTKQNKIYTIPFTVFFQPFILMRTLTFHHHDTRTVDEL